MNRPLPSSTKDSNSKLTCSVSELAKLNETELANLLQKVWTEESMLTNFEVVKTQVSCNGILVHVTV